MSETVRLERDGDVATVVIDDPERNNPMTRDAYARLIELLDAAEDARCTVLEGEGDAFCAGGDVEEMGDGLDERPPPAVEAERIRAHEQTAVERLIEHPVPTVSKVDGPAVADGAALAVACDLTLASERARIGFTHVRFGLTLDAGSSYLLDRLVGRKRALELGLTGEVIGADEAEEMGLVTRVYPDESFEDEADAVVERIAAGPPLAQRHTKRLLRLSNASLSEALDAEATAQAALFETDDFREGVRAFLEGREPEFEGR